jgi:hypothetical protein
MTSVCTPDYVTDFRLSMWRGGYLPLPCHGKRPAMDGWQKHHQTNEAEIHLWDRVFPYDTNTGCLTRDTPTLDVDITARDACRAVFKHIRGRFKEGGIVLCRIGNAPKFAVPFRTGAPFKKFETKLISWAGERMKFEFLGDGQQFIVDGIHPDTQQPYRWWPADRDPSTVPYQNLPPIDEAGARALVEELTALLAREFGFKQEKPPSSIVPRASPCTISLCAVHASLMGILRTVVTANEGNRNALLFWGACRIRDMNAAGELDHEATADATAALHEAATRTGLAPSEINRTISSGMRPRA